MPLESGDEYVGFAENEKFLAKYTSLPQTVAKNRGTDFYIN